MYFYIYILIVCFLNILWYLYGDNFNLWGIDFKKIKKTNLTKLAFVVSTICGLLIGFIISAFLLNFTMNISLIIEKFIYCNVIGFINKIFNPIVFPKLLLPICKILYSNIFLFILLILNIPISEICSYFVLIIGNYITDGSLYRDIKSDKPNPEKVFNRFTLYMCLSSLLAFIIELLIHYEIIQKILKIKKYMNNVDKYIYILILSFWILYIIAAYAILKSLVNNNKISKDWIEIFFVILKSVLTAIVIIAGLYAINFLSMEMNALSASLYPMIDTWKYIHDEIKNKEKENKKIDWMKRHITM